MSGRTLDECEEEIERLHDMLEAAGHNSRGVVDIMGRTFPVPVDAEHKSKILAVGTASQPHMAAFHLSWTGFFATFFSTFAAAPLLPYIKKSLRLERPQIANANMASVGSTILARVLMGYVADVTGARKGMAIVLLVTVPPLLGMYFVHDATAFIVCRGLIGISLASFVACQAWVSVMFSKPIVGLANATAGGWGNLGGGFTNLLMPYIFLMMLPLCGGSEDITWRACFVWPAALHLILGLATLAGRDLPDGNFDELEMSGAKQKSDGAVVFKVGISNINAWLLTILYGMSFGVELTITNEAALYFHEYHQLPVTTAGVLASSFGMMNLFARSVGGLVSDRLNLSFGMRGRIWCLMVVQALEGVFCILLGKATSSMPLEDIPKSGTVPLCVLYLCVFSLFVQMAEGGTYSIVPQVSRAALGIVSGIVGAGGNLGSVVTTKVFFASDELRTDEAFVYLGLAIVASSALAALLFFPDEGGAFCRGGGGYDPQLIKPPPGYRGSDAMDYAALKSPALKAPAAPGKAVVLSALSGHPVQPPVGDDTAPTLVGLASAEEGVGEACRRSMSTSDFRRSLASDALEQALKGAVAPTVAGEEAKLDELRLLKPQMSTSQLRAKLSEANGEVEKAAASLQGQGLNGATVLL